MITGFDISTTTIGVSHFSDEGELISLSYLKMDVSDDVESDYKYLEKSKIFFEYLKNLKNDINPKHIIVESPLENSNNINTVRMLARFNGICCFGIYQIFGFYPKMITVNESRKIFCPEFVKTTFIKESNPLYKKTLKKLKLKDNFESQKILLEKYNIEPHLKIEKTSLSTPKDLDIKDYIQKKVSKEYPQIKWEYDKKDVLKKENFDMSDAFVVCYSGIKKYKLIENL